MRSVKRILHIVPSTGQGSGGLGPIAIGLAQAQRALGQKTAIWCLGLPNEKMTQNLDDLDMPIVINPVVGPPKIGLSLMAERMAVSEAGARYEVLHQHGIWMANSRITNRWRNAFRGPTIIAPQGALAEQAFKFSTWKKRLALLGYEAKNLQSASCLQATSEAEAIEFQRFGLRNPIAILPNGIPDIWLTSTGDGYGFRHRYSIPQSKRLLLFLSRLHPKKGLPMLFEALASMQQQLTNWHLVIAGPDEGNHRRELQVLSEKLNIQHLVQFVGPLYGSEKRDVLDAAEIFVLPTYSEGAPVAVVEALGAGVPVLTTRGAPCEELRIHRCGWWVDINPIAIQEALLDAVHRSKSELEEMGQRGRVLVANKYTWVQVAQKSLVLYQWLLGRGGQPDFVIKD
jgi:glycosyltransferase involved in cell wall biosynthesis